MIRHGWRNTKIYGIWHGIKKRCTCPTDQAYSNYGGRGITICDEWLDNPKEFCEWAMNNGYQEGTTIDRIDNDKGYSPENCRFVSMKVNQNNKNNNKKIELDGEVKTLTEWCEHFSCNRSTVYNRYHKGLRGLDLFTDTLSPYRYPKKREKKVSELDKERIIDLFLAGESLRSLSRIFNVPRIVLSRYVVNCKSYKRENGD